MTTDESATTSMTGAPWTPEPGAIQFITTPMDPPTEQWDDDDVYRFLSRDNPKVVIDANPDEVMVSALEPHTGAMVALIPTFEDLERLELDDGEPLIELHITTHFLGDAEFIDDQTRADIVSTLEELLADEPVIEANVFGVGVFNPTGDEPCLILNVAGAGLVRLRDIIDEGLADADAQVPEQHQPWVPHITLAYDENGAKWDSEDIAPQRMGPITIDRVRVAFGGQVTDIPLGLNVTAAATHVFHLPGKHDQSTHARGGASDKEIMMADKLNSGKKLNGNDPDELLLSQGITMWTGGGNDLGQVKYEMLEESREPGQRTPGGTLLRTVMAAPPNSPELHRGLKEVNPSHIPSAGQVVQLGPTSFTRDKGIRDTFAKPTSHSSFGHNTQVHITLKKNSRSLRIDENAVPHMRREKEWVSAGKFRVTKSTQREVTVKAVDGSKGKVTLFELEYEQVDDLTQVTGGIRETIMRPEGW